MTAGRARLLALEREARAQGFGLIARKAAAAEALRLETELLDAVTDLPRRRRVFAEAKSMQHLVDQGVLHLVGVPAPGALERTAAQVDDPIARRGERECSLTVALSKTLSRVLKNDDVQKALRGHAQLRELVGQGPAAFVPEP